MCTYVIEHNQLITTRQTAEQYLWNKALHSRERQILLWHYPRTISHTFVVRDSTWNGNCERKGMVPGRFTFCPANTSVRWSDGGRFVNVLPTHNRVERGDLLVYFWTFCNSSVYWTKLLGFIFVISTYTNSWLTFGQRQT